MGDNYRTNVFVLCTGRCGSTTLVRALGHCTNYTTGHETRTHCLGDARFAYPQNHIEADNRLSWMLGRLDEHYGANAFYIHLMRDPDLVAESFARRADQGIMHAYRSHILLRASYRSAHRSMLDFAHDYVQTVNSNIALFLRDKPGRMKFFIERGTEDIPELWDRIGAKGDIRSARAEFGIMHNAS